MLLRTWYWTTATFESGYRGRCRSARRRAQPKQLKGHCPSGLADGGDLRNYKDITKLDYGNPAFEITKTKNHDAFQRRKCGGKHIFGDPPP